MQAWVSWSGGRTLACDAHAFGGAQCGELRDLDLEHNATQKQANKPGKVLVS